LVLEWERGRVKRGVKERNKREGEGLKRERGEKGGKERGRVGEVEGEGECEGGEGLVKERVKRRGRVVKEG
jgi:hypothetical protein